MPNDKNGIGIALTIPAEAISNADAMVGKLTLLNEQADLLVQNFKNVRGEVQGLNQDIGKLKDITIKVKLDGKESLITSLDDIKKRINELGKVEAPVSTGEGASKMTQEINKQVEHDLTTLAGLKGKIKDIKAEIDKVMAMPADQRPAGFDPNTLKAELDACIQKYKDLRTFLQDSARQKLQMHLSLPTDTIDMCINKLTVLRKSTDEFASSKLSVDQKSQGLLVLKKAMQEVYEQMLRIRSADLKAALNLPQDSMEQLSDKLKTLKAAMEGINNTAAFAKKNGFKLVVPSRDLELAERQFERLKKKNEEFANLTKKTEKDVTASLDRLAKKNLTSYDQIRSALEQLARIQEMYSNRLNVYGVLSVSENKNYQTAKQMYTDLAARLQILGKAYDDASAKAAMNKAFSAPTSSVIELTERLRLLQEAEKEVAKPGALNLSAQTDNLRRIREEIARTKQDLSSMAEANFNAALGKTVDTSSIDQLKQKLLEINTAWAELNRHNKAAAASLKGDYYNATRDIHDKIRQINQETNRNKHQMDQMAASVKGVADKTNELGMRLKYAFSLMAVNNYIKKIVKIRGEFEMVEKSLTVILKDANKARETFNELTEMAVRSPYTLDEISKQTKQLAAYRIEYEELVPTVKMLGDVASGTGVEMNRLILAYGQVRAAQFLKGTELRQFTEAGVDMLGGLADRFTEIYHRAVSVGEVMKMISKKQVLFEDVKAVMEDMTAAGGTFYKMQEKQAETISGMISNIEDRISIMFNEIGKGHDFLIKGVINLINKILSQYKLVGAVMAAAFSAKIITMFSRSLASVWQNLKYIGKSQIEIEESMRALRAEQAALTGATKVMRLHWDAVLGIIGAAALGLIQYMKTVNQLKNDLRDIGSENMTEQDKLVNNYKKYVAIADDVSMSYRERAEAMSKLKSEYGNILPAEELEMENMGKMADMMERHIYLIKNYISDKAIQGMMDETIASINKSIPNKMKRVREELTSFFNFIENYKGGSTFTLFDVDNDTITEALNTLGEEMLAGEVDAKNYEEALERLFEIIDKIAGSNGKLKELASEEFIHYMNGPAGNAFKAFVDKYANALKTYDKVSDEFTFDDFQLPEQFNEAKAAIDDLHESYVALRDEISKEDGKYKKNDPALTLETQKRAASTVFKDVNDKIEDAVIRIFNDYGTKAKLDESVTSEVASTIENILGEAYQAFLNGKLDPKNSPEVFKKMQDLYKEYDSKLLGYFAAMGTDPKWKEIRNIILNAIDVKFTLDDLVNLMTSLGTLPEVIANKLREMFLKKAKDELVGGFDKLLMEYNSEVLEKIEGFNDKFGFFRTDNSESEMKHYEQMGKKWQELNEMKQTFYAYDATAESQSAALSEAQVESIEELEDQLQAIDIVFAHLPKSLTDAFKGIKKKTDDTDSDLNKRKQSVKELVKEVIRYNDEMDEMAPAAKKLMMESLNALRNKAGVSLPKDFDAETIKRWISSINDALLESDDKASFRLDVEMNVDEHIVKDMKNQIADLWDQYDNAIELEELGFHFENFDSRQILAELDKMYESVLEYSLEAANDLAKKRNEIYRKELVDALKIASEATKKTLTETEQAYEDGFREISQMIGQITGGGTDEDKALTAGINARLANMFKAVAKSQYEAYKETDMYIAAFGDLDNVNIDIINTLKEQLEYWKDQKEELSPTEAKTYAQAMQKLNEAASAPEVKSYFGIIGKGFKTLHDVSGVNASLPGAIDKVTAANRTFIESLKAERQAQDEVNKALENRNNDPSEENNAAYELAIENLARASQNATSAMKILDNAQADYNNLISKGKGLIDGYKKKTDQVTQGFDSSSKVIDGCIDIVEKFGDALGLTLSDDTKDMLDSFKKGFSVVSSAISLANTNFDAMSANLTLVTGQVITLETLLWPLLAAAAAIGAISAVIKASDNAKLESIEQQQKVVDELEKSFERLEKTMESALYSKDVTRAYKEQVQNIEAQRKALREMITLEQSRGDKMDADAIDDYNEKLEELLDTEKEAMDNFYERLGVDNDWADTASSWADSWLSAFRETGDGLASLEDDFDKMFDDIIAKQMQLVVMGPFIERLKDTVYSILQDGEVSAAEMKEVDNMRYELSDLNNRLKDFATQLGITMGSEFKTENLQKGIQGITETTAQALESILNSMRFYVAESNVDQKSIQALLMDQTGSINPMLNELKNHTRILSSIDSRLSGVIRTTGMGDVVRTSVV